MRKISTYCCLILFLAACSTDRRELGYALRAAGTNRVQLESVLEHYSHSEQDTLKLRAAKYLIRYMPLHRSFDLSAELLYDRMDSLIAQYKDKDSLAEAVTRLCERSAPTIRKVWDVQTIRADFLIRNIEQAFDLWQRPWARHLDFDAFCECLLPYKSVDLQPLTDWRSELAGRYNGKLGQYASEVWRDNSRVAAWEVNNALCAHKYSYRIESNPFPVFRATTFTNLPKGTCDEACIAVASIMRSKGIPVSIDFTPNWTARPKGHYWMAVVDHRHCNVPFSPYAQVMGDPYFADRPLAKVFRIVYRPNAEVERIIARDGWIPQSLASVFVRDITEIYTKADTVDYPLYDLPGLDGTVYLAVFDNRRWVPVCWGKRRRNGARFEKIGRNVLYMPVVYDRQRALHPAGDPFYLRSNGELEVMHPDTTHRRSVVMKRKYGVYEEINTIRPNLMGGVVSASNDPQFRSARDILLPLDTLILSSELTVQWPDSFRYWRIRSTNDWPCDMAEVQFFDDDVKLRPRVFPAPGPEDYPCARIADDDALTYCALKEPDCRVGFDFGRPVQLSKILWFRRSDGNDIYPGHEYTLHYWNNSRWTGIESRRAGNRTQVEFQNVPDNALLLLVCDTEGVQNRPFIYRNEEVCWR